MVVLEKDRIEYQEANALLIGYNSAGWIAGAIFFSAAFAILGLSGQVTEITVLIVYAMSSVWLYVIGCLIGERFRFYSERIFERLWELEKQMGLNLHLYIRRKDKEATLKSPVLHSLTKVRYLRVLILVFLLLFWVLRIVLPFFF